MGGEQPYPRGVVILVIAVTIAVGATGVAPQMVQASDGVDDVQWSSSSSSQVYDVYDESTYDTPGEVTVTHKYPEKQLFSVGLFKEGAPFREYVGSISELRYGAKWEEVYAEEKQDDEFVWKFTVDDHTAKVTYPFWDDHTRSTASFGNPSRVAYSDLWNGSGIQMTIIGKNLENDLSINNDDATISKPRFMFTLEEGQYEKTHSFWISDRQINNPDLNEQVTIEYRVSHAEGTTRSHPLEVFLNGNRIDSATGGGTHSVSVDYSLLTAGENKLTISGETVENGWDPTEHSSYAYTVDNVQVTAPTDGDYDNDGVKNWNDPAPHDPDRDNDGVKDGPDKAPDIPEDQDGYKDDDGVPENPAPSVSVGGTQLDGGDSTTITAQANDPEDDPLSYSWSLSGPGSIEGSGASVTYEAPDLVSADTSAEVSVTVHEEDESKSAGESATVDIKANDPDDDGIPNSEDEAPYKPEDFDGYKDGDGVPENPAPSVSLNGFQTTEGSTTEVTVQANDPEREPLAYSWSLSGAGSISGTGSSVTYEAPSKVSSDRSATISVTVTEEDAKKSSQDSADVTVTDDPSNNDPDGDGIPNSEDEAPYKPEDFDGYKDGDGVPENPAPSVSITDQSLSEGASVVVSADGTDPEGEQLEYEWTVSGKGTISGSGSSVTYIAPESVSRAHTEEILVTTYEADAEKSAMDRATVSVTKEETSIDPVIEYTPREPTTAAPVILDASNTTVTNAEIEKIGWDLTDNDSIEKAGKTIKTNLSSGMHVIEMIVTATDGKTANETVTISVDAETDLKPAFSYGPQAPTVDTDITFNASNSTTTGAEVAEYRWDFTGNGVTDATGEKAVHSFGEGKHQVTLTIVDEEGATVSTSQVVEVLPENVEVSVTASDTEVTVGDTTHITYSLTNYLTSSELTVQLLVDTPSGVEVVGVEGADAGSNQFTAVTTLEPASQDDIRVSLEPTTTGEHTITAIADYYFSHNTTDTERIQDEVSFTATQTGDEDSEQGTEQTFLSEMPGFGIGPAMIALGGAGYVLKRRVTGST